MINNLNKIKKVHFIGIGGIGVSAIARMMLLDGKEVSGSDESVSEITDELAKLGARIFVGQKSGQVPKDADLVIYTIAITTDNPEFIDAKKYGLQMMTYPEALGLISKEKYTIAVSGTHGKTTTTAMIAKILVDAKENPTVVVGSLLKDGVQGKSNFIAGSGKYFVAEACEYRRSFLNLNPSILVITNIDNDHLDYYKDLADIESAFREMAMKVPRTGFVVCDVKNKHISKVVEGIKAKVVDYMDFFDKELILKIPGKHNKIDAAAAFSVAHILGFQKKITKESLKKFSGTWRRFEYKGETKNGVIVYDDYGHHPTEIKATLLGAREFFGKKKIIVVFQPHLYSRTKLLLNDFSVAFKTADQVLLAPIYAARETKDDSISSEILAEKINKTSMKAKSFNCLEDIEKFVLENFNKDDVVITIGAGDIYKVGEKLLKYD